ncbi:D-amino-acid transaminase [Paenisporosarcina cavernae]|uniref:D-alanine aminotransferase n=1 Tax=Paenisporosarcina cavernae TaxID=2320858 RepID=A0A385YVG2_9BACL|nr:D-amino-acid transaminase [Paenisporosarcina cavernae]AYC29887.1 D-amino-acid transaminase [Paenisporosarcina cavernae]
MNWVMWNDRYVKEEEIMISIEDRGYQFGDGIYEVIRVYEGSLFTAQEHIDRFFASAEKIGIVVPFTKDVFHKRMYDLVEMNEVRTGQVYVQITRGAAPRAHQYPDSSVPAVITAYTKEVARPLTQFELGVAAKTIEDIRWLRCDIKSLNLLGNVMAKQEAIQANCFEAILHRGDRVTEGSSSNMYGVKDGIVYTHPVDNYILNGITRSVVKESCQRLRIPFVEEAMDLQDLSTMDEFFLTSTTAEITPIVEIDGNSVGSGRPGNITRQLQLAFEEKIALNEPSLYTI